MVAFLDHAIAFTRPFFEGEIRIGIGDLVFQLDLGRLNLGDARLERGFIVVEADHGGHTVIEIHHQEDQNDDNDDRDNLTVEPVDFFDFFPQVFHTASPDK